MIIALAVEIERHNPGVDTTLIVRRNAELIADLAKAYPHIHIVRIEKTLTGLISLIWEAFRRPYSVFMPAAFGKSWFFNTELLFRLLTLRPGTTTYGLLKKEGDLNPYTVGLVYAPHALHIDNLRTLASYAGFVVESAGALAKLSFRTVMPKDFPYAPSSYMVFHPFGSSSWKSWPSRRSRELLAQLGERYPTYSFVLTGGEENLKEAELIAEGLPRVTVAVGIPILEAAAVIEGAALFIGIDTGTLHLASIMHQEVIALEHNASPEWIPTYNPNTIVLSTHEHCTCTGTKNDTCKVEVDGLPYMRCLYEITDDMILGAIETKIGA